VRAVYPSLQLGKLTWPFTLSQQSHPPSTPKRAPPREPCSYSSFSNWAAVQRRPALSKSCRMLRPPTGLQGSAAGPRCQGEGAGLVEFSIHCHQGLFSGSGKGGGYHLLLGEGVKHLPLQWFQCVCMDLAVRLCVRRKPSC
jgi:hypothetical protein